MKPNFGSCIFLELLYVLGPQQCVSFICAEKKNRKTNRQTDKQRKRKEKQKEKDKLDQGVYPIFIYPQYCTIFICAECCYKKNGQMCSSFIEFQLQSTLMFHGKSNFPLFFVAWPPGRFSYIFVKNIIYHWENEHKLPKNGHIFKIYLADSG